MKKLLVLCFLAISCSTTNTIKKLPPVMENNVVMETAAIDRKINADEIRPGNTLSIRHSVDKKLSGNFKVNWDGSIELPYGKSFRTNDLTTGLFTEQLKEAYAGLYKSGNSFQVSIANDSLLVEVRGLVKKPGPLYVKDNTTLEEIITKSDIDKDQADFVRIELDGRTQWIDLKQYGSGNWPADKMPKWAGGETVWFVRGDNHFTKGSADIRLMGEVNQPGAFAFQNGKSVLDYITMAGGLKSSANIEKVYIYRPTEKGQSVANFTLLEPQSFSLAPGDTLLITSERSESIERRFQMGANVAAILSAIGVILLAL